MSREVLCNFSTPDGLCGESCELYSFSKTVSAIFERNDFETNDIYYQSKELRWSDPERYMDVMTHKILSGIECGLKPSDCDNVQRKPLI